MRATSGRRLHITVVIKESCALPCKLAKSVLYFTNITIGQTHDVANTTPINMAPKLIFTWITWIMTPTWIYSRIIQNQMSRHAEKRFVDKGMSLKKRGEENDCFETTADVIYLHLVRMGQTPLLQQLDLDLLMALDHIRRVGISANQVTTRNGLLRNQMSVERYDKRAWYMGENETHNWLWEFSQCWVTHLVASVFCGKKSPKRATYHMNMYSSVIAPDMLSKPGRPQILL